MTMLSKNFAREEFECKCGMCGEDTVDAELITVLQDVRDHFGKGVRVTSGVRCEVYNKKIGGSDKSQHILGRAADIQVKGVEPSKVYRYLELKYAGKLGLGGYDDFTHVDSRSEGGARW